MLSWMCFSIKCVWVDHQTVLTLTPRDAEDTTVTSFSLDLLAISASRFTEEVVTSTGSPIASRSDRVKGC